MNDATGRACRPECGCPPSSPGGYPHPAAAAPESGYTAWISTPLPCAGRDWVKAAGWRRWGGSVSVSASWRRPRRCWSAAHGMDLTVSPLTSGRWPALEDLFGQAGASNGCWCMYWRIGPRYRDRPREDNKDDLRRLAASGQPPGLLAFDGGIAVGWCELAPRADLAWLAHSRYLQPVDGLPVWSVPCFYVRRTHRGQGVMDALIEAALLVAASAGAPAVEAYPVQHGGAGPHRQPVPRGRLGLRPARLPGRGPAQAGPPADAEKPQRSRVTCPARRSPARTPVPGTGPRGQAQPRAVRGQGNLTPQ